MKELQDDMAEGVNIVPVSVDYRIYTPRKGDHTTSTLATALRRIPGVLLDSNVGIDLKATTGFVVIVSLAGKFGKVHEKILEQVVQYLFKEGLIYSPKGILLPY